MSVPQLGPCSPFCDAEDVREFPGCADSPPDDEKVTLAITVASRIMYLALGEKFDGTCATRSYRPCGCGLCGGVNVQDMGWAVILWPGGGGCGGSCVGVGCGCDGACQIDLGLRPIQTVHEVKVDGAVLTEGVNYRVDDFSTLVRIDGGSWPVCQNIRLADTEVGTWSVNVTHGLPPSELAVQGTAQLACEIAKLFNTGTCALDPKTERVVRQGITIDMTRLKKLSDEHGNFRTGLTITDLAIATENPDGFGGPGEEFFTVYDDLPPRRTNT